MKNHIKTALYFLVIIILHSCRCDVEETEISIYKNNTEHNIKIIRYYSNEELNVFIDKRDKYQTTQFNKKLVYADSTKVIWDDRYVVTHLTNDSVGVARYVPQTNSLFKPDSYTTTSRKIGKCGEEYTNTYIFTEEDYEYAKSLNQTN